MKSLRSTLSKSSTLVGSLAGKVALDFETQTTSGPIKFHDWTGDNWVILFSCQGSYTPDELLDIGRRAADLEKRNIKVLGISTSGLDSHRKWVSVVNSGWSAKSDSSETTFELASDADKRICAAYDLLGEETVAKSSKTSRNTVVVVDPQKTIRLTLAYPASVTRNFEEILKAIDTPEAMQIGNGTNPNGNDANGKGGVLGSPLSSQTTVVGEGADGHLPSGSENKRSLTNIAGRTLQRVSTFGVVATVGAIAEPMWNSPYLDNAMQVLEQVADLGRTLPFVAPAFMLFKIIIEIEQRAKDVDVKCRDLIERITFMLGHLFALKTLEVAESTRHVVERINNALKDAAALIEAYRRQRPLARRLSLNNRQKFEECALTLKGCTDDLLISLQIHQSGQLEILARAIPVDPEDQAAQSFLDSHGSLENLRHHPELVSEFAQQQHLVMDEQVMEELNSNISDVIQQNHARLEHILKDNVNAALIDGMKALAQQMDQVEMEQKLTCIQCGKEYRNSTNGPKSCAFHKSEYSSWSKSYGCCSSSNPCQFKFHRSKHHCDYPYGTFFEFSRGILNYVDTTETWAKAEDSDFEKNDVQVAFVGKLYRWVSKGEHITEPTILIKVGSVWHTTPYFFDTFTSKELVAIANIVSLTSRTLIYRTSKENSEFAMAEWILSNGTISGVRVSAKAATSSAPFTLECPIDITTCTKSGDVRTISEGGFRSYKPDRAYELPKTVRSGPEISYKPIREVRKDFKTRTTATFPVILKVMSNPPLKANSQYAGREGDNFEGEISVFNNHPAGSQNYITIASITAAYRLVGDEDYQPLPKLEVKSSHALPVTIEPRQSWNFQFFTWIQRSQDDIDLNINWWNRALLARHRPLRLKLNVQDISGEECSIVTEYVFEPFPPDTKEARHLDFLYIDNPEIYDRHGIHVEKATNDNNIMSIGSDITVDQLKKITYNALKTGETEIDLKIGAEKGDGAWEWKAWALVDLSCCRVYAIKILVAEGKLAKTKHSACLGYVPVPEYGDITDEIRPIQYAAETVKLPDLEPYVAKEYLTDDTFDDFVPEPAKLSNGMPASGGPSLGYGVLSEELSSRLISIDTNLARIAAALELLVATKAN